MSSPLRQLTTPTPTLDSPLFRAQQSAQQFIAIGGVSKQSFEFMIAPLNPFLVGTGEHVTAPVGFSEASPTSTTATDATSQPSPASLQQRNPSAPVASPVIPLVAPAPMPQSRYEVLTLWEGTVSTVDPDSAEFAAVYRDLTDRSNPEEMATFDLAEVSDQDLDLVKPGAIFYWNVGYEITPSGTKKRFSVIRFRRLPSWTKSELEAVDREAAELNALFGADGLYSTSVGASVGDGDNEERRPR